MYFCLFVYLSLKDIFVNICKALLCNGIKHLIITGGFQKISIPYHGQHLHVDLPLPSEFQTILPPPPPCLQNSIIIQTPLRNCHFFLPTDLISPLFIPNTFIKWKLILSLPPKEKNVHSAQQTINVA